MHRTPLSHWTLASRLWKMQIGRSEWNFEIGKIDKSWTTITKGFFARLTKSLPACDKFNKVRVRLERIDENDSWESISLIILVAAMNRAIVVLDNLHEFRNITIRSRSVFAKWRLTSGWEFYDFCSVKELKVTRKKEKERFVASRSTRYRALTKGIRIFARLNWQNRVEQGEDSWQLRPKPVTTVELLPHWTTG